MTDRRGVVARRAEDLSPGVPYVRGWRQARHSAEILAEELSVLGLDEDFPGLAADVNVSGDGLVRLGIVRPEAARLLADLILSGLAGEMVLRAEAATNHGSGHIGGSADCLG
ncbi:hypothetical protein [Streptomyces mangrovisoli]|uniref:Uncharacterized protein n=1 Tax=Streptomyces mangrovisoli TaxID=1428628 RepID=A0A1J4P368_9ACTN|nr:hypothetical protein [Streptomyces mangrovisoli]OIJ69201.1 hypothetical protein WN71_003845 [Streptomyces mangrovisoli]